MALNKLGPKLGEWLDFRAILNDVKTLDFSTGTNKAIFYSGPGNRAKALEFANITGKTPIDYTSGGRYLESLDLYSKLPSKLADKIWSAASKAYAEGASGQINLFVSGARADRVFKIIEEPIVKRNTNVYKWIYRGY